MIHGLEAQGLPLINRVVQALQVDHPGDQMAPVKQAITGLAPAVADPILHLAVDSPHVQSLTPRRRSRVANDRAFSSTELRGHVRDAGVCVIGCRDLRALPEAAGQRRVGG